MEAVEGKWGKKLNEERDRGRGEGQEVGGGRNQVRERGRASAQLLLATGSSPYRCAPPCSQKSHEPLGLGMLELQPGVGGAGCRVALVHTWCSLSLSLTPTPHPRPA